MSNASRTPAARAAWWLAIPISASLGASAPGAAALRQRQLAAGAPGRGRRGRRAIAAQVKAGEERLPDASASPATRPTARACPARSRRSPDRISCSATRTAPSAWSCAACRARSWSTAVKFNSVMPAMMQLSDQEIADALTYAMNSWGNKGGAVSVAQVAAERARPREPKKADSPTQHPTTIGRAEVPGRAVAGRRRRRQDPRDARRAEHDDGRVRARAEDLLPALRRLPRRAAQGRHGQAAHARHHAEEGHRVPEGVHQPGFAGRHAELGQVGRAHAGGSGHHGALRPARAAAAARIRHEGDQGDLEGAGAGRRSGRRPSRTSSTSTTSSP